jgi:hypothetical protein
MPAGKRNLLFLGYMPEFVINVTEIEELQTVKDLQTLDNIFTRAKRIVNGGGSTVLIRKHANGGADKFDEITTLEDLEKYRQWVYKYL